MEASPTGSFVDLMAKFCYWKFFNFNKIVWCCLSWEAVLLMWQQHCLFPLKALKGWNCRHILSTYSVRSVKICDHCKELLIFYTKVIRKVMYVSIWYRQEHANYVYSGMFGPGVSFGIQLWRRDLSHTTHYYIKIWKMCGNRKSPFSCVSQSVIYFFKIRDNRRFTITEWRTFSHYVVSVHFTQP